MQEKALAPLRSHVIANSSGLLSSEKRYMLLRCAQDRLRGEERWANGTLPTTFHFTGQREDSYIKSYWTGSRW